MGINKLSNLREVGEVLFKMLNGGLRYKQIGFLRNHAIEVFTVAGSQMYEFVIPHPGFPVCVGAFI